MTEREEALERARQAQQELLKRNSGVQNEFRGIQGRMTSPYRTRRGYAGPASDLPVNDFDELYPSRVGVSPAVGRDGTLFTPFGREFAFDGSDKLEQMSVGGNPERVATVQERAQSFLGDYFDGKQSPVINPASGIPYGKELAVHDAFHEYANVSNTLRGEELVTIGESAANTPLQRFGLTGLTQQNHDLMARLGKWFNGEEEIASFSENSAISKARMQDGPPGRRSLSRTLTQQRGAGRGSSLFRDRNAVTSFLSPPIQKWEASEMINRGREYYDQIHSNWKGFVDEAESASPEENSRRFIQGKTRAGTSPALEASIRGGYAGGNRLPFGDIRQFMNAPLAPVVNYEDWNKSIERQTMKRAKDSIQRNPEFFQGESPEDVQWGVRNHLDGRLRNMHQGGPRGAMDLIPGRTELFLNPPNLGSNAVERGIPARDQFTDGVDTLLTAARDAKDSRLVRSAIRTGFNATADIAGSVPLLDPEFRQAVERGRPGTAAGIVARDYAIGTAAAPVVGAGAGVLQRVAPRAAARVLPAVAGATRVGNPVAVVSQLGGDSRQSQAQVVADRQRAEAQLNAAHQARARGGRWRIGSLRLPELGISETGGLLFGGNRSGRQIGTRAVLNGKPVVWTGDSYGWQSAASAAKVGVR
jgi:hypothetical protein